jgi:hypothetical protein
VGPAPGISTTPTTNVNIGLEDEANAAAARGALANAPRGFEAIGIRDALDMYEQGKISLTEAIGYGLHNALGFPGTQIGFNVNPRDQTQTPAMDISIPGMALGALGMISGVPGLGMVGGRAGTAIGGAFGIPSVTVDYSPGQFGAPAPDTNSGFDYINQNAPRLMKHGGMVGGKKSLEELHHRYAEGGEVGDEGMVRPYDPREVDTIANEFMREISPVDVTQRARMLMRGVDVKAPIVADAQDLPENYMRYPRNENVTSSTNYFEMPIEDDRYGQRPGMRSLRTGINAILDQERKIGLGAGLMAMENAGDYGMTGYGPQVSASYGPASIFGGYQSMTPSFSGAKPQGVYSYGGNLNIPLDEDGASANIGGSIISGRRGAVGAGNAGTQIMGGLQVPFERLFPNSNIGGTLGLDVAVDPTLRQKEILFGYRRAF